MSEVSTLPSPSYLNHSSTASTPEPSTSTDPAQLLRQAALSSRKLKRRKLDSSSPITSLPRPLPRSIVSVPSIALDYGPEEPSSAASTEDRTPITTVQPPITPTQSLAQTYPPLPDASSGTAPQISQTDDLSAREEGEISENEDPPFQPPPKSAPTSGVVYHARADSPAFVHSPFGSRSPSVKAEDAYRHATPPLSASRRLSVEATSIPPKMQAPLEPFRLETPLYVLDTQHVRPGLSLTQRQYDTAKEVILDILGYGVPPEYLIDCGLSREIIYYVFTELNLRLPNNLDIAGIPPYPPPLDVMASILSSQSSYSLPSAPLDNSNVADDAGVRRSSAFSPQPLAPHDPGRSSQAPAPASQEGSTSASLLALSESTLAAMERQRKQELLARKAVQASRKRKEPMPLDAAEPSTWPPTATPAGTDLSARTSTTAVSVEDFLNSIGPPVYDGADPKQDLISENEPRDMETDSPEPAGVIERNSIPDDDWSRLLDRTSVPPSLEDASLPASASASEANFSFEREQRKWASPRILENPPARSRSDGTLAPPSRGDDGYDSRRSSSTPQPNAPTSRRGTKRPVAADFDSDPVPKAYTPPVSRTGSGAGLNYGGGYYPNSHVRHKTNGVTAGGFASLNSTRRCVIDVSDSEDESSEEELSSATGMQPTPRDSALALEQEIERMRKMIREREELKLRKQAMASNRSTPVFSEQQPGDTRTSEETSETGPSASTSATTTATTRNEVSRSESCDTQSPENVLASELHCDVNDAGQSPGPITSSPSPPGSTPLSFEDSSIGQVAVALLTSTDQSTTPAADDQTIGGPALAADYRQESASAASPETSTSRHIKESTHSHHSEDEPERETVDVLASVQQVPSGSQVKMGSSFTPYNSVLSHYPFLSGRSLGAQEMDDRLNLKQLKIQAAARRLSENQLENARICQFEVPGGGECRDADCGDMHLSQLEAEPKDDETAQYLCGDQNVAQMIQALQAARARRPEATFNERVKAAWESMRVQASLDSKT